MGSILDMKSGADQREASARDTRGYALVFSLYKPTALKERSASETSPRNEGWFRVDASRLQRSANGCHARGQIPGGLLQLSGGES